VKDFLRVLAVLLGCSSAGCGGAGETGPVEATSGTPPAAVSHAWDEWNWDEGGFGD
jgi:hypothetical protein